jgi:hypothetical protein
MELLLTAACLLQVYRDGLGLSVSLHGFTAKQGLWLACEA